MKILVGISGGVDSAVSAYLLKQQGHDIVGGFMLNYLDESDPQCTTKADLQVFHEVCNYLKIPYEILDFRKEYEQKILNYIYEGYLAGLTPNPDVLCNTEVKFKLFLEEALQLGYDRIATGHYAQIKQKAESGKPNAAFSLPPSTFSFQPSAFSLYRGIDNQKDQSYFLAGLNQQQLSKALFPIGHLTKPQVRQIAQDAGLPNAQRKDSQGLCFVGKVAMSDFLKQKIGPKPGHIILQDGTIVGEHQGAYQFTVGQRRGIGLHFQCYVTRVDVTTNTVVVTKELNDNDLFRNVFSLRATHWISGQQPKLPLECMCKVRYRQELQPCQVNIQDSGGITIHTKAAQKGVPNGQICVLYGGENNDEVLGCGEISS